MKALRIMHTKFCQNWPRTFREVKNIHFSCITLYITTCKLTLTPKSVAYFSTELLALINLITHLLRIYKLAKLQSLQFWRRIISDPIEFYHFLQFLAPVGCSPLILTTMKALRIMHTNFAQNWPRTFRDFSLYNNTIYV